MIRSVRGVFNVYQATVSELNKPVFGAFERPVLAVSRPWAAKLLGGCL